MMVLAWHRKGVGNPYPCLWYINLPTKGEGDPAAKAMIVQSHTLTEAEQAELDALPDGVSRVDYAAKKYPYVDPDPVDKAPRVLIVTEVQQIITNVSEVV